MKFKIGDRVHILDFKHAYVHGNFKPFGTVQAIREKDDASDLNVRVLMDDENAEVHRHYVLCFDENYLEKDGK